MADGLRRARSARGWSQARLILAIETYAREHLIDIASSPSLKVYVSEWENGRRPVSREYAAILRAVLGMDDAELFGSDQDQDATDGYGELVSRIEASRLVDRNMVATLMQQTDLLRAMDRQLGAANVFDQMQAHLTTLQETLRFAVLPNARRGVARALAGAATLAAWQALDAGAAERAWRHYELARSAAYETGQTIYLAHAMGEQAYVLSDAGQNDLAVELVREAQNVAGTQVPARLVAWLRSAEAELCAIAGNDIACRRALDAAAAALPDGVEARDPEIPSVFLNEGHLARWRGNALAKLGDAEAVGDLYSALTTMDPTFMRAQAGLHCDLAQAHLMRGEQSEALDHLRKARLFANRTGSVRHRKRIERLTQAI